ncbi:methyltransferase domain-containing protein [Kitasatospora sp. NPDC050543]|uniref:methyltransferase domain-containing protein n=1 Tax=Kitasatospora sp. NPDC050543 TaxID=3364054 RepID=UPI0037B38DB2
MSRNEAYGAWFYAGQQDGSVRSAERVLPLVLDLVQPSSVVDLGCGTGAWLATALRLGTDTVLGVDGPWVTEETLHIPYDRFLPHDLSQPLDVDELRPDGPGSRFGLAMSLEAAEHLEADRADSLVADLCALSECVLFSAAIPGQTGSDHRNEQWPPYWRARFERHGHQLVDCLRSRLWADPEIEPWYAQNAYLYVSADRLAADERLREAASENDRMPLTAVHPGILALFSKPFAPPNPEPLQRRAAPMRFKST